MNPPAANAPADPAPRCPYELSLVGNGQPAQTQVFVFVKPPNGETPFAVSSFCPVWRGRSGLIGRS